MARTSSVPDSYGMEYILDVHNCTLRTRAAIEQFCIALCRVLKMQREDLVFWDYADKPEEYEKAPSHLKGTSAVQFIRTSNITIHALDELRRVYLNIFSCKPFDTTRVRKFIQRRLGGTIVNAIIVTRV